LLNDYSDVIVSAIHEHGGDVLKLIGDGTLAIFTRKPYARMQRGIIRCDRCTPRCCRIEKTPHGGRQASN
jgi:hypothetical protein